MQHWNGAVALVAAGLQNPADATWQTFWIQTRAKESTPASDRQNACEALWPVWAQHSQGAVSGVVAAVLHVFSSPLQIPLFTHWGTKAL